MSSSAGDDWRHSTPVVVLLDQTAKLKWRGRLTIAIPWCVWLYVLFVLVVWLFLRFAGERWWLATMMLFGPRWIYGLPLLMLIPAAAILRPHLLWPLVLGAIVVVVPIMGLCLPWGRAVAPDGPSVRVLTCNVDDKSVNSEAMSKLIETVKPDIVALQECPGGVNYQWPTGWHVCQYGELLVVSRYPVQEVQRMQGPRPGHVWPRGTLLHCVVATPDHDIDFCCVHLPSPRQGIAVVLDRSTVLAPSRSGLIDEGADQRQRQSEEVARLLEGSFTSVIVAGDFNTPTDSSIYRRAWSRYRNAFSTSGFGFGNTIRPKVHGWRFGIRIDHILTGPNWWPRDCWVGPDIGSEHLPVIADLVWNPGHDEQSSADSRRQSEE